MTACRICPGLRIRRCSLTARPVSPGDAGDTAAAQDKRASVHDRHLYTGTNARAQDLWRRNMSAHPGSTNAGCILLVHRGVHSHQDTANLIWRPWRGQDARIEELGLGIADRLGPQVRLNAWSSATCAVA
jgi:hypothetical protein